MDECGRVFFVAIAKGVRIKCKLKLFLVAKMRQQESIAGVSTILFL
jgi:hypothetical protein